MVWSPFLSHTDSSQLVLWILLPHTASGTPTPPLPLSNRTRSDAWVVSVYAALAGRGGMGTGTSLGTSTAWTGQATALAALQSGLHLPVLLPGVMQKRGPTSLRSN